MALPLVTTLVSLFYLGAVPIRIAVRYRSGTSLGVGVAPFEERFALRHALKPLKLPAAKPKASDFPSILRCIRCLVKHIRLESVSLSGSFGCDDAALTALVCGGVNSIGCIFRTRSKSVFISLRPDFNASSLRADVSGMISVRVGHIILAALLALLEYSSGRLKTWTSTPSKAL